MHERLIAQRVFTSLGIASSDFAGRADSVHDFKVAFGIARGNTSLHLRENERYTFRNKSTGSA
jgi:hypothetical protein